MQVVEKPYSSFTQKPELYAPTYWGSFEVEETILQTNQNFVQMFSNRNKLAEDYSLRKNISKNKVPDYVYQHVRQRLGFYDHIEFYENSVGDWVIVNSPYGIEPSNIPIMTELGWTHSYPVYSSNADTFVKVVPKKKKSVSH